MAFADQDKIGAWASRAITQAYLSGIIFGYTDKSFRPGLEITRAEIAAIVARAFSFTVEDNSETRFTDEDEIPNWAKAAVSSLLRERIAVGRDGGMFAPSATATRAEALVMLLRCLESEA
jgi:hypothetical protein